MIIKGKNVKEFIEDLNDPTPIPLHPETKKLLKEAEKICERNLIFITPNMNGNDTMIKFYKDRAEKQSVYYKKVFEEGSKAGIIKCLKIINDPQGWSKTKCNCCFKDKNCGNPTEHFLTWFKNSKNDIENLLKGDEEK